jgi:hypothetical protein
MTSANSSGARRVDLVFHRHHHRALRRDATSMAGGGTLAHHLAGVKSGSRRLPP